LFFPFHDSEFDAMSVSGCKGLLSFSRSLLVLFGVLGASATCAFGATPTSKVRFYMNIGETGTQISGNVEIELYGTQSPLGVANFLTYVDNGSYNDSIIHRTRDGATVATSDLFAQGGSFKQNGASITAGPAVVNEYNAANGLTNVAYTLAAARSTTLNSATSGWFINQENNATAFVNYTVLGKVTLGTAIIDRLPFLNNLPILQGSSLESMPIYNNGEVVINRAIRIPIISGDYNFSGSVTAADYTLWRNSLGSTTNLAADGSGNGIVDAADYVIYRKKFGAISGAGAGTSAEFDVPEPLSNLLILSAMLIFTALTRRRAGAAPYH
jgi:cyclophilin family peptidyl-prolyl cis-trans isomerase